MKEFYIVIVNDPDGTMLLKHVQYNILKRGSKFKYCFYKRVEICIIDGEEEISIESSHNSAKVFLAKELVNNIRDIPNIYKQIERGLITLWNINNWNKDDLNSMFEEIKSEKYSSTFEFGRHLSPDKKSKMQFNCEIHSSYADYYLQYLDKKNNILKKVLFLKGLPDIMQFFLFFNSYKWISNETFVLSDLNGEIFFVFKVDDDFIIDFQPRYNTLESCKNYVKAFSFDINYQERMRLLGLK